MAHREWLTQWENHENEIWDGIWRKFVLPRGLVVEPHDFELLDLADFKKYLEDDDDKDTIITDLFAPLQISKPDFANSEIAMMTQILIQQSNTLLSKMEKSSSDYMEHIEMEQQSNNRMDSLEIRLSQELETSHEVTDKKINEMQEQLQKMKHIIWEEVMS